MFYVRVTGNELYQQIQVRMYRIISTVFILFVASFSPGRSLPNVQYGCKSPHYAEVGHRDVIRCHIPLNFKAVVWYNVSMSDEDIDPIVAYSSKNMDKMGTQWLDGTMDITANGSLIINHVTSFHDAKLKIVVVNHDDHVISSFVTVVVFVKPKQAYPVIGTCNEKVCYQHFSESKLTATCYLNTARPAAELSWIKQLRTEQQRVNSEEDIEKKDDGTFDAFVTFKIEKETDELLGLFVCRSYWQPERLHQSSTVLIDFSDNVHDAYEQSQVDLVVGKIGTLSCGGATPAMMLWKKVRDDGFLEVLGWNTVKKTMNTDLDDNIKISITGELVFNDMKLENEGTYMCVYDDGTHRRVVYNISLTAVVPPEPPYPAIRDCTDDGNCTFTGNTGTLECSLSGVKPMIDLEWRYDGSLPIALTNHRKLVHRKQVFDVVLTADYEITRTPLCKETLLIVCATTDPTPKKFQSSTQVIIFPDGLCETQADMNLAEMRTQLKKKGYISVRKAVFIVFIFIFLLGIIASCLIGYCWGRHKNGEGTDRKGDNRQNSNSSGQNEAKPEVNKAADLPDTPTSNDKIFQGKTEAEPGVNKAQAADLPDTPSSNA